MPTIQTRLISLKRADGGVSLMQYVIVGRGSVLPSGAVWLDQAQALWLRPESDENIEHEISDMKAIDPTADIVSWRRIEPGEVPTDRTYRNAWTDNGKAIVHDMAQARAIHLAKLRRKRNAKLLETDGQVMRANETGEDAVALLNRRQAWRDFPSAIEPALNACADIEALKAIALPE